MQVRWWIYLHVLGAFLFVTSHGVSMFVSFRLRKEREPARVAALLQVSGSALWFFYGAFLLLLTGGIVAGFMLHSWGRGWIWTALGILIGTMFFMYAVATPYYRKVRTVTEAIEGGSEAVTPEEYTRLLRSPRPFILAAEGTAALVVILWLMLFKPF
ncbi:MAG: DUF2269 family protein [Actinomycetota bacterium]